MQVRQISSKVLVGVLLAGVAMTGHAAEVELTTGEVLKGEVVAQDETTVTLQHPVLGPLSLPRASVAAMRGVEPEAAAVAEEPMPEPVTDDGVLGGFFRGWESELSAAIAGSSGNSDNLNLRIGLLATRETDTDLWKFDAAFYYAEDDSTTTDTEFTTGLYKEWKFVDSKWGVFAQGRYDFDDFNSYEHRASAHAGVTYRLIEKDDFKLKLLGGLGAIKEWESMNDDVRFEGLLGADVDWQIADNQKLTASTRFYPDLSDFGEFRWTNGVAWTLAVSKARGLDFRLGIDHEYNSVVDAGKKKNDLKYYGGLVYKF